MYLYFLCLIIQQLYFILFFSIDFRYHFFFEIWLNPSTDINFDRRRLYTINLKSNLNIKYRCTNVCLLIVYQWYVYYSNGTRVYVSNLGFEKLAGLVAKRDVIFVVGLNYRRSALQHSSGNNCRLRQCYVIGTEVPSLGYNELILRKTSRIIII